jgi:hypothetical protein
MLIPPADALRNDTLNSRFEYFFYLPVFSQKRILQTFMILKYPP